ncbi:MAG: hypothetical protein ACTHKE_10515 [Sphingomicrobium sp.]
MYKFILGPVLMGTGYLAGSYYGSDAEQLVHKSPDVTYSAVEQALDNVRPSGSTSFDGGTPVPYQMTVDRTLDQRLVVTLLFNGQQGAVADVIFTPQNDGKDTLMVTKIHVDRSVLRTALAGTDKARLGYAPDWMLNLTLKPVLKKLAEQIEQGQAASLMTEGEAEAQWENNLSEEQRQGVAEWRQYDATRPSVDPNAAAQNYASGNSEGQ